MLVELTRKQLEDLKTLVAAKIKGTLAECEHYLKRDAEKHPERLTAQKFKARAIRLIDIQQQLIQAKEL